MQCFPLDLLFFLLLRLWLLFFLMGNFTSKMLRSIIYACSWFIGHQSAHSTSFTSEEGLLCSLPYRNAIKVKILYFMILQDADLTFRCIFIAALCIGHPCLLALPSTLVFRAYLRLVSDRGVNFTLKMLKGIINACSWFSVNQCAYSTS